MGFLEKIVWALLSLNPAFRRAFDAFKAGVTDDSRLRRSREELAQFIRDYYKKYGYNDRCKKYREYFIKRIGYDPLEGEALD